MLQLNHMLDESENWDTNWARKHLKIPPEQLKKLENIPEWCTHQISTTENTASRRVHIVNTEKDSLLQSNLISEKFIQSNSATKNIENSKVSNLLSSAKNKPINFSLTENRLTRSASLNFLNLCDKFVDDINLRPSNSVPNISNSYLASIEHHTIYATDSQESETSKLSKLNPSEGKLNDTFIVSKVNKMESFSQPEMNYNRCPSVTIQLPIEKLADKILNHKYLKESVNSTRKSDDTELLEVSIQKGSRQNILDLPSPSNESVLATKGNPTQDDNLANTKTQELLKPVFQVPKATELQVLSTIPNAVFGPSVMLNEDCVHAGTAGVQNLVKESGVKVNQDEGKDAMNYEYVPFARPREAAKNEGALSVNNDDTFGSQLIPCGQPMPAEVDLCPLPNVSKEANTELPYKSVDVLTNIAASTGNSDGNVITQNLPHVGIRISGTKRKRKSKVETPKKIREAKHSIHFTEDQVRNMLEMIKMLHSES